MKDELYEKAFAAFVSAFSALTTEELVELARSAYDPGEPPDEGII